MQESVVRVDYDSLETCKNFKPSVGTELIVLEKDIAHARFKGNESMVYERKILCMPGLCLLRAIMRPCAR